MRWDVGVCRLFQSLKSDLEYALAVSASTFSANFYWALLRGSSPAPCRTAGLCFVGSP
jgi:hypothetical protein